MRTYVSGDPESLARRSKRCSVEVAGADEDDVMHPPTFAAGVRLPFAELPSTVTDWVAATLGGAISAVADQRGGFSPGVAAVVTTRTGRRGFVKAVSSSINTESIVFHRGWRTP